MLFSNPFQVPNRSNQHNFTQVPSAEIQRSSFDRSHGLKTAFNGGDLVPIFVDEVLPGDTFNMGLSAVARLSTPIVPFMDNLYCDFFFFYIPNRLVWSNFKKMMGEQNNPTDSTSFILPTSTSTAVTGYAVGSLQDYMGLPTGIPGYVHNTLPLRSYNLCWNEWFRDENLQNSVTVDLGDGPDTPANYTILKRGKRKDYFTSALPWPQKGTAVTLPIGSSATVKLTDTRPLTGIEQKIRVANGALNGNVGMRSDASGNFAEDAGAPRWLDPNGSLYADLSTATAATINQLRQAFQLQRLYERDARGGTRYTEIIRSHFGVVSPDARLQRPEVLATGSRQISLHPVPQTSSTAGSNPQGGLAAFGTLNAQGIGFTKSFTEHGIILGLASVRADLNYQQGLHRMWTRSTKTDFYWPALAHLGEQAVLNKEIYCVGTGGTSDEGVFGYQERFAEYRFKPSVITGKMRSTASGTLDIWHLAQKFTTLPTLGATFIQEAPPIDRVVAVNTEPQIIMDCFFKLTCARPMPVFSVPGMIDHF